MNSHLCEGAANAATHDLLYHLHMNGIIQLCLRNVSEIEVKSWLTWQKDISSVFHERK